MSLVVLAYSRDANTGATIDIESAPPHNQLAGFESWRERVWGAEVVKGLGLTLIPSLALGDIYAERADLDLLASEIETLTEHVARIAESTEVRKDSLRF